MEEHLNDKSRIGNEWQALCGYSPEQSSTTIANLPANVSKNRYSNALPCKRRTHEATRPLLALDADIVFVCSEDDHSRIVLHNSDTDGDSDYINASAIVSPQAT
jgi:protein tyrosine phosphatase